MLKRLHRILILTVVAVIACGNGLAFAAPDTLIHHHSKANGDVAAAHNGHQHNDGAHDHNHADNDTATLADQCADTGCASADHSNFPCCHTHAHCCTSLMSLAVDHSTSGPTLSKGALLFAAAAPVPLGNISYPLLRPPRNRV